MNNRPQPNHELQFIRVTYNRRYRLRCFSNAISGDIVDLSLVSLHSPYWKKRRIINTCMYESIQCVETATLRKVP